MRTGEHLTGPDRVAECAERLLADAYINIQGHEPFISPTAIDTVSEAMEHLAPGTPAVGADPLPARRSATIPAPARPLRLHRNGPQHVPGIYPRGREGLPKTWKCCASSNTVTAYGCSASWTKGWRSTPPRTSRGPAPCCGLTPRVRSPTPPDDRGRRLLPAVRRPARTLPLDHAPAPGAGTAARSAFRPPLLQTPALAPQGSMQPTSSDARSIPGLPTRLKHMCSKFRLTR
ncbi:cytidylyltransferase domain-containing protein [Streptomyces sp. Ag109_G2-15]|uniref:cytidylyltransferase domain-containing protein n=1 Tax=Streptomyces sp. Ag109_G2-15 TaxID=1938850 RepID=UPI00211BE0A7|nr:hypothetical protein [Streptomyces sp. Ag109_G2-15]